jgi:hypothetical protein
MWNRLSFRRKRQRSADEVAQALRGELRALLAKGNKLRALEVLTRLEVVDGCEPRWPHKRGDLLRSLGQERKAAACYQTAADRYELVGFPHRGEAMRLLARRLDPHTAVHTSMHPMLVGSVLA